MNSEYGFRLLTLITATILSGLLMQGCAAGSGAPFYRYDSPLLAGNSEARYPKIRSFDPFNLGSRHSPDSSENTAPAAAATPSMATQTPPAPTQKQSASTPALSTHHSTEPIAATDFSRTGDPALAAAYVWSVYQLNGVRFPNAARRSIPKLFRACKKVGRVYHSALPAIGDIVFFHNTADQNADGRNNDWYTHAAIVESHGGDGTITLLGYRDGEVRRIMMDLGSPDAALDRHGEPINSRLRTPTDQDAPFTQYLTGQLFAGTCAALGERTQFIIVDNWDPGMDLSR